MTDGTPKQNNSEQASVAGKKSQETVVPEKPKPQANRTFFSDITETTNANDPVVAQQIFDEARGQQAEHERRSPGSRKNLFFLIGTGVLLLIGVAIILWGISVKSSLVDILPGKNPESLVYAEEHKGIDITGIADFDIIRATSVFKTEVHDKDTIENIFFVQKNNGGQTQIQSNDLWELTSSSIPKSLQRTLNPFFMYGWYSGDSSTRAPFLLLVTDDFNNAFDGMIEWQQDITFDLAGLMGIQNTGQFHNVDFARDISSNYEIYHADGSEGDQIIYSFIRENILIITTDTVAIDEVSARLANRALVR
ncbi:MAG: hypothetical protein OEX08_01760 [Candidatus Nomurabacteria bacterium]|nr:hypothetical protein [Candidatus Nomurabacteria bacterium]